MGESQSQQPQDGSWWVALFFTGLMGIAVLDPNQNLAEAAGRILGLIIGSATLTGIPLFICAFLGKAMNMKQQMWAFTVAWMLVIAAQFVVKHHAERGGALVEWRKGSLTKPVKLPSSEVRKITGTAQNVHTDLGGTSIYGGFSPTIYNGTEWTLTDVDIELSTNSSSKRIFRFQRSKINPLTKAEEFAPMPAFSTVKPYAEDGDFLSEAKAGEWSWRIVGARGFKQ